MATRGGGILLIGFVVTLVPGLLASGLALIYVSVLSFLLGLSLAAAVVVVVVVVTVIVRAARQ